MDCYIQNNQAGLPPHTMHKNKFKWMKDLNVVHETIKLLEDNTCNMLFNTGLGNIFWKRILRQGEQKQIYTKKVKLQRFCTVRKLPTKCDGHLLNGRRCLQMTYWKMWIVKLHKNSTSKKFKNGESEQIFPNKTYRWPAST